MKVNINKYQMGGGFTPFTPIFGQYVRGQETPQQESAKTKESSPKGIIDDDIYKELIGKGLNNEVNYFVEQLIKIEQAPGGLTLPENRSTALRVIAKINELQNNSEDWKKALSTAEKNEGLGEIAVGPMGELYTLDTRGSLKKISLSEYSKKKDKIKPLTVTELMKERKNNPNLIFNNNIFSVAESSIGTNKIISDIKSSLEILSDFSEDTKQTYSRELLEQQYQELTGKKKLSSEAKKQLIDLAAILQTPGDSYEIRNKLTTKRVAVENALNFIWAGLEHTKQNKLNAVAITQGKSSGKELVLDMLMAKTNPQTIKEITPKIDPQKVEKAKEESLASQKNLSLFQILNRGLMQQPIDNQYLLNSKNGSMFIGTIGSRGALVNEKDETIGMTTLGNILTGFGYDRFVKPNQVYFGQTKVDLHNLNNVIYDPEGGFNRVYLPVVRDGEVDYDSIDAFRDLYKVYEANKDSWTAKEATDFFNKHNFQITIDEKNGEKIIRENELVKPFMLLYGYTNSATGLTEKDDLIEKLNKEEKEAIVPILEQIWTVRDGKKERNLTPDASWHREKYYKGVITIPYQDGSDVYIDAVSGKGPKIPSYSIARVQSNMMNSSNQPLNSTIGGDALNR